MVDVTFVVVVLTRRLYCSWKIKWFTSPFKDLLNLQLISSKELLKYQKSFLLHRHTVWLKRQFSTIIDASFDFPIIANVVFDSSVC